MLWCCSAAMPRARTCTSVFMINTLFIKHQNHTHSTRGCMLTVFLLLLSTPFSPHAITNYVPESTSTATYAQPKIPIMLDHFIPKRFKIPKMHFPVSISHLPSSYSILPNPLFSLHETLNSFQTHNIIPLFLSSPPSSTTKQTHQPPPQPQQSPSSTSQHSPTP